MKTFVLLLVLCGLFQSSNGRLDVKVVHLPEQCKPYAARRSVVGDKMEVRYKATISATTQEGNVGDVWDATEGGNGYRFQLGSTGLLNGWEEALVNMCVGERREVIFPAGYGWDDTPIGAAAAAGSETHKKIVSGRGKALPIGADLSFELEFVAFHDPPSDKTNFFEEMDRNKDGRVTKDEMGKWFRSKHPRGMGDIPHGLWERQDKNKDDVVTWEEFSGPKGSARSEL